MRKGFTSISIVVDQRDSAITTFHDDDLRTEFIFLIRSIIITILTLNQKLHVSKEMVHVNIDEICIHIMIRKSEEMGNDFRDTDFSKTV